MAIDKLIKKRVTEDWLNIFSHLSAFNRDKLYKVIGPCLVGIELVNSPYMESYSPHFVIYPLWKKDVRTSLNYPILLKDFKNIKGFQYEIPYEKHSTLFDDVIYRVKEQMPFSFEGDVSFGLLLSSLDDYSKTAPLNAAPTSYLQAVLHESKLKIALYIGISEAQRIFEQIKRKTWDESHFKACGADVNCWFRGLYDMLAKRDEFIWQIERNGQDKKIAKLSASELTA